MYRIGLEPPESKESRVLRARVAVGDGGWLEPNFRLLQLTEEDFVWATLNLMDIAARHCYGRVVSMLEGGYDLQGLASSVAVHVQALMRGSGDQQVPEVEDED